MARMNGDEEIQKTIHEQRVVAFKMALISLMESADGEEAFKQLLVKFLSSREGIDASKHLFDEWIKDSKATLGGWVIMTIASAVLGLVGYYVGLKGK